MLRRVCAFSKRGLALQFRLIGNAIVKASSAAFSTAAATHQHAPTTVPSTVTVNGTTFDLPAPGEHFIVASIDGMSQVRPALF